MVDNSIEDIRKNAVTEIKEKVKKNPKFLNPVNKERLEYQKKLKFANGNEFACWMQQNGILNSPARARDKYCQERGFKNRKDYEKKICAGNDSRRKRELENNSVSLGELRKLAKKYGKEYNSEFVKWAIDNGIFKNPTDINNEYDENAAKNVKCKDVNEYRRMLYKNNIEDNRRYARERLWNKDTSPISENENCPSYLGVNIGERILKEFLLTIFEHVKYMDYGNHGFDFICKDPRQEFINKYPQFKLVRDKEYKIQLELRCLYYRIDHKKDRSPYWKFHIQHNDVADIFILLGLDDRESLQFIHAWLFYRDDMIRKGNSYTKREKFWKRDSLTITDNQEYLKYFKKYEFPMDKLKELINKLKDEEEI